MSDDVIFITDTIALRQKKCFSPVSDGHGLTAAGDGSGKEDEKFLLEIVNRPALVVQGSHGFAARGEDTNELVMNSLTPEVFKVNARCGKYSVCTDDDKYWTLAEDDDKIVADGDVPVAFYFHLLSECQLQVKMTDDSYLCSGKEGELVSIEKEPEVGEASWWFAGKAVEVSDSPTPDRRSVIVAKPKETTEDVQRTKRDDETAIEKVKAPEKIARKPAEEKKGMCIIL
eukprot:m.148668 g.148668  ORF g.148668 m.148668 type:complete len:229 (+) comp38501_c0_seq3:2227-2913(+)